jgi:3-deoxy-7-phosphoheptulonate synthase
VEGKGKKPKPEAVGRFCCSRLFYFKAVGNRFHGIFFERRLHMLIVMEEKATEEQLEEVIRRIRSLNYECHIIPGQKGWVIGATGNGKGRHRIQVLECLPGVERVVPISSPYKLASLETKKEKSFLKINDIVIGNGKFVVMAGPCSVENEEQLMESARAVKEAGASILRGGAFKPRTSPYAFQGLGEEGLKLLGKARSQFGLAVVTEVINPQDVDLVASYADILQVGTRNAQNFSLLKEVGRVRKPVLLKRGMMTNIEEYLMSAEYILSEGNRDVILCERGIRTFETATRSTLDISAIPVLKEKTHLPVIVDPSHAAGNWKYVSPLSLAAVAAGADGLIIEVHPWPEKALSDGPQSLKPDRFQSLMEDIRQMVKLVGKDI